MRENKEIKENRDGESESGKRSSRMGTFFNLREENVIELRVRRRTRYRGEVVREIEKETD